MGLYLPGTYEEEIDSLKDWIVKRANWIDQNLDDLTDVNFANNEFFNFIKIIRTLLIRQQQ